MRVEAELELVLIELVRELAAAFSSAQNSRPSLSSPSHSELARARAASCPQETASPSPGHDAPATRESGLLIQKFQQGAR